MQLFPNPLIIPVGIAVGVLVSAPVGPVNVLCIQRAISRGVMGGRAAGIGAVLGDGPLVRGSSRRAGLGHERDQERHDKRGRHDRPPASEA